MQQGVAGFREAMMLEQKSWYFKNPKDGYELVLVPGGEFWMGSEAGAGTTTAGFVWPGHRSYSPLHFCLLPYAFAKAQVAGKRQGQSQNGEGEHPPQQYQEAVVQN